MKSNRNIYANTLNKVTCNVNITNIRCITLSGIWMPAISFKILTKVLVSYSIFNGRYFCSPQPRRAIVIAMEQDLELVLAECTVK